MCEVIGRYLRVRACTIPIDVINECYEKYLMSIGVASPSLYANVCLITCLLLIEILFVHIWKLPYICIAWAFVFSVYISAFVQITLSLRYIEVQRTLSKFDISALGDWSQFILLGIPGIAQTLTHNWHNFSRNCHNLNRNCNK